MTIIYFLEVQSTSDDHADLPENFINELSEKLARLPKLSELYLFTPVDGGHDPFLKDKYPPRLVVQALFNEVEQLALALASMEFKIVRDQLSNLVKKEGRLVQEAMELESFLSSETKKGMADISYLVNYQRPAEDEASFLKYYREHHPALLLKFPGIRRMELGYPIDWRVDEFATHADRMLFCEVSFDSIEELNESLNSEIRKELRADYECFPSFSGAVTHFSMLRQSIL